VCDNAILSDALGRPRLAGNIGFPCRHAVEAHAVG
jgi:hypothetical protein